MLHMHHLQLHGDVHVSLSYISIPLKHSAATSQHEFSYWQTNKTNTYKYLQIPNTTTMLYMLRYDHMKANTASHTYNDVAFKSKRAPNLDLWLVSADLRGNRKIFQVPRRSQQTSERHTWSTGPQKWLWTNLGFVWRRDNQPKTMTYVRPTVGNLKLVLLVSTA